MTYTNISEMRTVCENSKSISAAAKELGMKYDTLKKYAQAHGFFNPNQSGKGIPKKYYGVQFTLEDILDGKHPQYTTNKLKKRLIEGGVLDKVCVSCGITDEWNGKPIVLQLDHINGVNDDHALENLRLLCPNCHSQTDTWCGRNKAVKDLTDS